MCRGKVKNGGLRIELERKHAGLRSRAQGLWSGELGEFERENAGLRNRDCRTRLAGILAGR